MNAINDTLGFDKAYKECLDDAGQITRLEPLYDFARDLERRCNLLEAKLVALGDIAVSQWDDKVVGEVDALVPPEQQTKYADFLRNLFIEIPAERDELKRERDEARQALRLQTQNYISLYESVIGEGGQTSDEKDANEIATRHRVERDQLRKEIETIETRHAAVMLHAQAVVDENSKLRKVCDALHRSALFPEDYKFDHAAALEAYNQLPHVLSSKG